MTKKEIKIKEKELRIEMLKLQLLIAETDLEELKKPESKVGSENGVKKRVTGKTKI